MQHESSTGGRIRIVADDIVFSLQRIGGISIYWAKLVEALNDDPDFDVTLLERKDSMDNYARSALDLSNCRIVKSDLPLRVDEVRDPTLQRLDVQRPTLFHSSYFRTARNRNCVNIATIHDFISIEQFSGILKWFVFWQNWHAARRSDYIICISENTKADLLKYVPAARKKHIEVIYQGFDSDSYTYEPTPRRQKVAFIGTRHLPYKNFEAAVEAVSLLSDVTLQIMGKPLTDKEAKFLDSKVPGRYESLVFPDSKEVCEQLRESIALLYLSEYEGFGVPVLEGMASGCPVIALNKSSILEVGGDAAILLDEADPVEVAACIEALRQDQALFDQVVERGLEQARKFSWEKTIAKTKDFYKRIWNGEI